MLAVRGNERAAAVNGINVVATKLQAFALSAFIAGIGGGVLAYQLGAIAFERFSPMASIIAARRSPTSAASPPSGARSPRA